MPKSPVIHMSPACLSSLQRKIREESEGVTYGSRDRSDHRSYQKTGAEEWHQQRLSSDPSKWDPTPYSGRSGGPPADAFECIDSPEPLRALPLPPPHLAPPDGTPPVLQRGSNRASFRTCHSTEKARMGQVAHLFAKLRGSASKATFSSPGGAPAPSGTAGVVGCLTPPAVQPPGVGIVISPRGGGGVPRHSKTHEEGGGIETLISSSVGGTGRGRHHRVQVRLLHDAVGGGDSEGNTARHHAGETGIILRRMPASGMLEVEMDRGGSIVIPHWCAVPIDMDIGDIDFSDAAQEAPRRSHRDPRSVRNRPPSESPRVNPATPGEGQSVNNPAVVTPQRAQRVKPDGRRGESVLDGVGPLPRGERERERYIPLGPAGGGGSPAGPTAPSSSFSSTPAAPPSPPSSSAPAAAPVGLPSGGSGSLGPRNPPPQLSPVGVGGARIPAAGGGGGGGSGSGSAAPTPPAAGVSGGPSAAPQAPPQAAPTGQAEEAEAEAEAKPTPGVASAPPPGLPAAASAVAELSDLVATPSLLSHSPTTPNSPHGVALAKRSSLSVHPSNAGGDHRKGDRRVSFTISAGSTPVHGGRPGPGMPSPGRPGVPQPPSVGTFIGRLDAELSRRDGGGRAAVPGGDASVGVQGVVPVAQQDLSEDGSQTVLFGVGNGGGGADQRQQQRLSSSPAGSLPSADRASPPHTAAVEAAASSHSGSAGSAGVGGGGGGGGGAASSPAVGGGASALATAGATPPPPGTSPVTPLLSHSVASRPSYSDFFMERVGSGSGAGRFSASSDSSEEEEDDGTAVAAVMSPSSRARRRWKFLSRNLHNIRTGMHHKDYHGAVKGFLDRKRFIKVAIEARRAQKFDTHTPPPGRVGAAQAGAADLDASSSPLGGVEVESSDASSSFSENVGAAQRVPSMEELQLLLETQGDHRDTARRSVPPGTLPAITLTGTSPQADPKRNPGYMMKVAFSELLQTEKSFVTHLKLITERFIPAVTPFLDRDEGKGASDGAMLFANIEYLLKIHTALLEGIQRHVAQWERLNDAGTWIIDWGLDMSLRDARSSKQPGAVQALLQPPDGDAEKELLSQRRYIDHLSLLVTVFKDQVSARGGPDKVFSRLTLRGGGGGGGGGGDPADDNAIPKQAFWMFCRKNLLLSAEATARVFQEVDTDQNASINKDELYRITSDMLFTRWCKAVMSRGEGHEVFDLLDTEKSGTISCEVFLEFSQGTLGFSAEESSTVLTAMSQSTPAAAAPSAPAAVPVSITRAEFCQPLGLTVLSNSTDIGELLQLVVPLVKSAYTRFANNFTDSMKAHERLRANSPPFVRACKRVTSSGETKGLNLADLLITPIQRMMRYPLILKETLRHIPCKSTHNAPLVERIQHAITRMTALNQLVDASVTKRHNYDKLQELSDKIVFKLKDNSGGFTLVHDGRRLVKSGPLVVLCRSGVRKQVYFYLFNDILLYTNPKTNQCRHVIMLEQIELLDMDDQPDMKNAWVLKSPKVSFIVSASSSEEKDEWATTLLANSDSLRGDNPALVLQPLAPVWTSPSSTSSCTACDKPFNIFRRKHHCYHCGYLVCRTCSRHKFFLPHINETAMVQVCSFCFDGLTQERELLLKAKGLLGRKKRDSISLSIPGSPLPSRPSLMSPPSLHDDSGNLRPMRGGHSASIISASTMNVSEEAREGKEGKEGREGRDPSAVGSPPRRGHGGSVYSDAQTQDGLMSPPRSMAGTLRDQSKRNVEAYLRSQSYHDTVSPGRKSWRWADDDDGATLPSMVHEDTVTLNNSVHVQISDLKVHEYHIHTLQERLIGRNKPVIIKPGRRLLLSSLLLKKGTRDWVKYRFILFSDALMYFKEAAFSKLIFKNELPLLHMRVEPVEGGDAEKYGGISFKILSTKKSFIVKPVENVPDFVSRDEWVQHVLFAVEQRRLQLGVKGGLDGVIAAVRKPAEVGQLCASATCQKPLPKLAKATHCTACGGVFCKTCIGREYYTSPGVKGPTCSDCYSRLRSATLRIAAEFLHDPSHDPPLFAEATICYICKTRFTLFKTKRECWSCCAVVCADCSPHKSILQRLNPNRPMRVCSPCYSGSPSVASPLTAEAAGGHDSVTSMSSKPGDDAQFTSQASSVRAFGVDAVTSDGTTTVG